MEFLYVCHFSNGHIKVGRSIDPASRISAHADRVKVAGVELVENHVVECIGSANRREALLIARCVDAADSRNAYEWFGGLDYPQVCEWADEEAKRTNVQRHTRWSALIADLRPFMQQAEIADACGISKSNLSRLAIGQADDPLHSVGEKLIALHASRQAA